VNRKPAAAGGLALSAAAKGNATMRRVYENIFHPASLAARDGDREFHAIKLRVGGEAPIVAVRRGESPPASHDETAMRGPKLDRIDRQILDLLQRSGRMTNIELARRVGISPPPCLRRVRALEEAGLIRGYHADLAAEALGFRVTVFAQVGLRSQAETDLRAFETLVAGWPEVREAHMLAGETDFLLKIVASDWDSYQRFLSTRLTVAPNVAHVKSALVLRVSKSLPGVPLAPEAADADWAGAPRLALARGR
jgi:DNA-binding Lrp family transcriptional regulator